MLQGHIETERTIMTTQKADYVTLTPLGFVNFPNFAKPDTGRPNASGKYGAQLFIAKSEFANNGPGMQLVHNILAAGRAVFGQHVQFNQFKHTLYDVDTLPAEKRAKLPESVRTGYIQINTSSKRPPVVKDANQRVMTLDEIERISGGDVCRFVVNPFYYPQQGGGIALGLNVVQFKEKGPIVFGGGNSGVELLSNIPVAMQQPSEMAQFGQPVAAAPQAAFQAPPVQQFAPQAQPVQQAVVQPVAVAQPVQTAQPVQAAQGMFGGLGL